MLTVNDQPQALGDKPTQEQDREGDGVGARPIESYGPHTEDDRIDHCGSCEAENPPQEEDKCPECGATGYLISTYGEFQHQRYRNGKRYEDGGPQDWEDGPQEAPPAKLSSE